MITQIQIIISMIAGYGLIRLAEYLLTKIWRKDGTGTSKDTTTDASHKQ